MNSVANVKFRQCGCDEGRRVVGKKKTTKNRDEKQNHIQNRHYKGKKRKKRATGLRRENEKGKEERWWYIYGKV